MHFENLVLDCKLIKPCEKLLQKLNIILRELRHINKESGHILKLINDPLLDQKSCELVTRYEVADLLICLGSFHIQHPLVVQTFSLDHLPVMDSYAKQDEVHELTQSKLN